MRERKGKPNSRIPQPTVPGGDDPIEFSFGYLDCGENSKFRLDDCPADYLKAVFKAIQYWTGRTVNEFCEPAPERRNHQIIFEETSETEGFRHLDEQLRTHEAWQFGLQKDKEWRVHGMLIGNVFHIVWLDPFHRLYKPPKRKRKGGKRKP